MTPEDRLAELCRLDTDGQELEILPFYGHKPEPNGAIGAGCLSQWWPAPFTVDGVDYPTAEHWMMAGKARLFDDEESLAVGDHLDRWGIFAHDARPLLPTCASSPTRSYRGFQATVRATKFPCIEYVFYFAQRESVMPDGFWYVNISVQSERRTFVFEREK